jgi:hypothetical protein
MKVLRAVYAVSWLAIAALLWPLPLWRFLLAVVLIMWWAGTVARLAVLDQQDKVLRRLTERRLRDER